MSVPLAALEAGGAVEFAYILLQTRSQTFRCDTVGIEVEVLDFLTDYPPCHWIYVETKDVAADPIGFHQWSAAAHERIGDTNTMEIVVSVEGILQRGIGELGQHESPEKRPRPTCEPLMDSDRGPIALLYLLLTQSKIRDEGNIKSLFDHRSIPPYPALARQKPGKTSIDAL